MEEVKSQSHIVELKVSEKMASEQCIDPFSLKFLVLVYTSVHKMSNKIVLFLFMRLGGFMSTVKENYCRLY